MRRLLTISHHRLVAGLIIGLAVCAAVVGARQLGFLQGAELTVYDQLLRFRPSRGTSEWPVVLVCIDERDIRRHGYPLPDAHLARALAGLVERGAAVVGVDLFRDLPTQGRADLKRVVEGDHRIIMIDKRLHGRVPAPEFMEGGARVGFADLKQDRDGVVRRGLLILWDDTETSRFHFSFALQLALRYLDPHGITLTPDPSDPANVRLGSSTIERFRSDDGGYSGADEGGYQYLLDFGRRRSFPMYSVSQILDDELPSDAVQGRIVILGNMSDSVSDRHETPLSAGLGGAGPQYGVEIHAQAADQLLRVALDGHTPVGSLSELSEGLLIMLWSLLGAVFVIQLRALWALPVIVGAGLVLMAITMSLFVYGWWIPLVSQAVAFLSASAAALVYVSQRNKAARAQIMLLFGKFVSPEVASALWGQREQFMKGARPRPQKLAVTVMVADLQGFTSVAEEMDPAQVIDWLNNYMGAMTRAVGEHGGIVEDYAGDGMKANFGVPVPRSSTAEIRKDARRAVDCALAIGEELSRVNAHLEAQGLPVGRVRMGICSGLVVVGSLGSAKRLAYTTVGDTVNKAARLETFDKEGFEAEPESRFRILIEESTLNLLGSGYATKAVGTHRLRGRDQAVTIHRVFGYTGASSEGG